METFSFFFWQGWQHIADLAAYDHILFVVALTAVYPIERWKTIAWLVTAFTLGHSLALAAATLQVISVSVPLVEFLIPVSILLTCVLNVLTAPTLENKTTDSWLQNTTFKYNLATFFGLIHGLGFSNYLRFILTQEESIFTPLLGFNIGLEIGQLLIVAVVLMFNFIFIQKLRIFLRDWTLFVSGAVFGIAFLLAIETGFNFFLGESN